MKESNSNNGHISLTSKHLKKSEPGHFKFIVKTFEPRPQSPMQKALSSIACLAKKLNPLSAKPESAELSR